jgi:hypothetical protein
VTEASAPVGTLRAYPDIDTAWKRLKEFTGGEFKEELTDYGTCCLFVEAEFARYAGMRPKYFRCSGWGVRNGRRVVTGPPCLPFRLPALVSDYR